MAATQVLPDICGRLVQAEDGGLSRMTMMKVGFPVIWMPCAVAVVWPGSYFILLNTLMAYGMVLSTIVCPVSAVWGQRFSAMAINDIDKMVSVPFAKLVFVLLLVWGYYLWGTTIYEDLSVASLLSSQTRDARSTQRAHAL